MEQLTPGVVAHGVGEGLAGYERRCCLCGNREKDPIHARDDRDHDFLFNPRGDS